MVGPTEENGCALETLEANRKSNSKLRTPNLRHTLLYGAVYIFFPIFASSDPNTVGCEG